MPTNGGSNLDKLTQHGLILSRTCLSRSLVWWTV